MSPEWLDDMDIDRTLVALRDHGPMSAISLKRRLDRRNIGYQVHLLTRAGCIQKLPAPDGERWPVYRWVEP